jgi:hypothetical protein
MKTEERFQIKPDITMSENGQAFIAEFQIWIDSEWVGTTKNLLHALELRKDWREGIMPNGTRREVAK